MNTEAKGFLKELLSGFDIIVSSHNPNAVIPYSRNLTGEYGNIYYRWNPYHKAFQISRIDFDEEVQKQGVLSRFLEYALETGGKAYPSIEVEVCQNPALTAFLKKNNWEVFGACELSIENCPSFRKPTK